MSDVTHKHYRPSEWIDPRIEIQHSPIAGSGMFARAPINEGDTVVIWGGGAVFTRNDVEAGKVDEDSTVPIGEGLYLGSILSKTWGPGILRPLSRGG